jgi:hypothetical protein
MTTDLEPNTIIVMRILRSIGENNQANEMMEKFNQVLGNDSRAKLFEKQELSGGNKRKFR